MSNPAWPEDLGASTITGRVLYMEGDGTDEDRDPDLTPVSNGKVTIKCSVPELRYVGDHGSALFVRRATKGTIDADGYLCSFDANGDPGERGIVVPATDDPKLNPTDFTYSITIDAGVGQYQTTFSIKAPAGEVVDLAQVAPVSSSGGSAIVVDTSTRVRAEAAAERAEAAAEEASRHRPDVTWDGTVIVVDGVAGPDLQGPEGDSAGGVSSWDDLADKPAEFPPATHAHSVDDVSGLTAALAGKSDAVHGHAITDVHGLEVALDGKQPSGDYAFSSRVAAVESSIDAKADAAHTHPIAEVDGLQAAFDYAIDGLATTEQVADAVGGLATEAYVNDAVQAIPEATTESAGLMPGSDKATLGTYRVGPENTIAGEGAGVEIDESVTYDSAGGAGGYRNTVVGAGAGAQNVRGWRNTALGAAAMRDNVDGYNNVAIGDSALERNAGGIGSGSPSVDDPGARNTAVGSYALRYNTTGRGNVGIGRNAAHTNVSGDNNTAVGTNAFSGSWSEGGQQDTKTGSNNVAVGYNALFASGSDDSVAIGQHALYAATQKEQTAVGAQAARAVTTGTYNVAIGARALLTQTTGGSCTVVGTGAAANLSTGSRNTAVGTSAMNVMTGGGSNTALGFEAGTSDESVNYTTALGTSATPVGNNSTAVGYNATTTGANQVQLGNSNTSTHVYGTVQNRSDARDKADVRDTELGLDFIEKLRPVDFRWDMREDYPDGEPDGTHKRTRFHHGVIAQELAEVIETTGRDFGGLQDHAVGGGDDVMTVGYDELIAPLIKAVQQLAEQVRNVQG